MKIELKILENGKEFYKQTPRGKRLGYQRDLPDYATEGSAGVDLRAIKDYTIYPGLTETIETGIAIHIGGGGNRRPVQEFHKPTDEIGLIATYEPLLIMGMIVPRSGLGSKGLILGNTLGIIDEDYQGEILINAWNRLESAVEVREIEGFRKTGLSPCFREVEINSIQIKAGDRIAQLIFLPIIKAQFEVVEEFSSITQRGSGGFGHSGES